MALLPCSKPLHKTTEFNEAVTSSLRRIEVGQPPKLHGRVGVRRLGRLLRPPVRQASCPGPRTIGSDTPGTSAKPLPQATCWLSGQVDLL